jgi:hypothetical protein
MSALPSFEPLEDRSPAQPLRRSRQTRAKTAPVRFDRPTAPATTQTSQRKPHVKSNPAYAHRRQGLEVGVKLVTYSCLSLFGVVTLVNSLGYNWAQHSKLEHLATELADARVRTAQVNRNFTRSFDPKLEQTVMEENSYKVAPDKLQIVIANPTSAQSEAARSSGK